MSDNGLVFQVQLVAALLIVLIVYHHVGYPLLLRLLARLGNRRRKQLNVQLRHFRQCVGDRRVPSIHLFIPVYNEADHIRDKVTSLAWLDYPRDKLTVTLLFDGCSDDSVERARLARSEFAVADLDIRLREFRHNQGKVAMVNEALGSCDAEIIAFSDVTAMLAVDCCWRVAHHFMCDHRVGVVTGQYTLLSAGSDGEASYWQYQNQIRALEGSLGAVMGAPGAFYAVRRFLCQPLEADTINDDFVLPMRAVAQGYRAEFDAQLLVFETEPSDLEMDAQRRIRISQGNMQQILRLKRLMLPDLGWVCWMFLSGKVLRVLMPYCMLAVLVLSAWLTPHHWLWGVVYLGQLSVYLLAAVHYLDDGQWISGAPLFKSKIVRLVSYLAIGHFMGLLGSAKYLLKSLNNRIRRLLRLSVKTHQPWS
jgi:cellulose synthase/poly-beta-1,6-N-acetylglucosamine synthase-like glycosyltransferase